MNDREHAAMMLTLAKHDLAALNAMKGSPEFTTAIFGFHVQQSVEKALKAWLTLAGGQLPQDTRHRGVACPLGGAKTDCASDVHAVGLSDGVCLAVQIRCV
jgi:hypothetical protein